MIKILIKIIKQATASVPVAKSLDMTTHTHTLRKESLLWVTVCV